MLVVLAGPLSARAGSTAATLRAEYTFDSITNGVTQDTSGSGHQLAISGNYSVIAGPQSQAVRFAPVSMASTASQADLNPGKRDFAVTVVFRIPSDTSQVTDTPNMAQKGFYNDAAQWKMQLEPSSAAIMCRFKGSIGAKLLTSSVTGVDDDVWHTATCWRRAGVLGVTLDGTATTSTYKVGDISNSRPMHIGAKSLTSTSDQFSGDIDYMSLAVGQGATSLSIQGSH
jgi:hypothetical protein